MCNRLIKWLKRNAALQQWEGVVAEEPEAEQKEDSAQDNQKSKVHTKTPRITAPSVRLGLRQNYVRCYRL